MSDIRESPALDIIHLLEAKGANVSYHAPHVPTFHHEGMEMASVRDLDAALAEADCVVIASDHSAVDWGEIARVASLALTVLLVCRSGCHRSKIKRKPSPQPMPQRIYLSPPHMSGQESNLVQEAFATNWIAPAGPHIAAFEDEFCKVVGSQHALPLASGTGALHLTLILAGVQKGDEVLTSTLTFAASANPVVYLGAKPVFVDSERISWNMDPALLAEALAQRARRGKLPRAVVLVHLYGQSANIDPILALCHEYGVTLIEDAAEALGASYKGRAPGTFGKAGFYSFNGNKIITTSGGGMLVSDDANFIAHACKLSTQAREPAPHYEHTEIGYNYRLSNVLAAIGRGQLQVLEERVKARRRNFSYYQTHLDDLPGVDFMPQATWGRHTRWLTVITVDPSEFGATREDIRLALEAENIESRPVWKPMHLQPVFRDCEIVGGTVSEEFFDRGLCRASFPSSTRPRAPGSETVSSFWLLTQSSFAVCGENVYPPCKAGRAFHTFSSNTAKDLIPTSDRQNGLRGTPIATQMTSHCLYLYGALYVSTLWQAFL